MVQLPHPAQSHPDFLGLRILIVEDDPLVRGACLEVAASLGHHVRCVDSVPEARKALAEELPDLVLLDMRLPGENGAVLLHELRSRDPDLQVVIMTAHASVSSAVSTLRQGVMDYLPKPFQLSALTSVFDQAAQVRHSRQSRLQIVHRLHAGAAAGPTHGDSPSMQRLGRLISRVALSSHPVLILGEAGVGKEGVGRAIHAGGPRAAHPFVPVDCGALAPISLADRLFGASADGETEASGGLLNATMGGTVYLDEIADLPLDLQHRLLGLLEARSRVRSADAEAPQPMRLLASTRHDLGDLVAAGRFRKDLFYRLNVVNVRVPALRERRSDLPLLVNRITERIGRQDGRVYSLSAPAWQLVQQYNWPGNLRELEVALERDCALSDSPVLHLRELVYQLRHAAPETTNPAQHDPVASPHAPREQPLTASKEAPVTLNLRQLERAAIAKSLDVSRGDKIHAARLLGIGKTTLYRKLKEYGIEQFLDD